MADKKKRGTNKRTTTKQARITEEMLRKDRNKRYDVDIDELIGNEEKEKQTYSKINTYKRRYKSYVATEQQKLDDYLKHFSKQIAMFDKAVRSLGSVTYKASATLGKVATPYKERLEEDIQEHPAAGLQFIGGRLGGPLMGYLLSTAYEAYAPVLREELRKLKDKIKSKFISIGTSESTFNNISSPSFSEGTEELDLTSEPSIESEFNINTTSTKHHSGLAKKTHARIHYKKRKPAVTIHGTTPTKIEAKKVSSPTALPENRIHTHIASISESSELITTDLRCIRNMLAGYTDTPVSLIPQISKPSRLGLNEVTLIQQSLKRKYDQVRNSILGPSATTIAPTGTLSSVAVNDEQKFREESLKLFKKIYGELLSIRVAQSRQAFDFGASVQKHLYTLITSIPLFSELSTMASYVIQGFNRMAKFFLGIRTSPYKKYIPQTGPLQERQYTVTTMIYFVLEEMGHILLQIKSGLEGYFGTKFPKPPDTPLAYTRMTIPKVVQSIAKLSKKKVTKPLATVLEKLRLGFESRREYIRSIVGAPIASEEEAKILPQIESYSITPSAIESIREVIKATRASGLTKKDIEAASKALFILGIHSIKRKFIRGKRLQRQLTTNIGQLFTKGKKSLEEQKRKGLASSYPIAPAPPGTLMLPPPPPPELPKSILSTYKYLADKFTNLTGKKTPSEKDVGKYYSDVASYFIKLRGVGTWLAGKASTSISDKFTKAKTKSVGTIPSQPAPPGTLMLPPPPPPEIPKPLLSTYKYLADKFTNLTGKKALSEKDVGKYYSDVASYLINLRGVGTWLVGKASTSISEKFTKAKAKTKSVGTIPSPPEPPPFNAPESVIKLYKTIANKFTDLTGKKAPSEKEISKYYSDIASYLVSLKQSVINKSEPITSSIGKTATTKGHELITELKKKIDKIELLNKKSYLAGIELPEGVTEEDIRNQFLNLAQMGGMLGPSGFSTVIIPRSMMGAGVFESISSLSAKAKKKLEKQLGQYSLPKSGLFAELKTKASEFVPKLVGSNVVNEPREGKVKLGKNVEVKSRDVYITLEGETKKVRKTKSNSKIADFLMKVFGFVGEGFLKAGGLIKSALSFGAKSLLTAFIIPAFAKMSKMALEFLSPRKIGEVLKLDKLSEMLGMTAVATKLKGVFTKVTSSEGILGKILGKIFRRGGAEVGEIAGEAAAKTGGEILTETGSRLALDFIPGLGNIVTCLFGLYGAYEDYKHHRWLDMIANLASSVVAWIPGVGPILGTALQILVSVHEFFSSSDHKKKAEQRKKEFLKATHANKLRGIGFHPNIAKPGGAKKSFMSRAWTSIKHGFHNALDAVVHHPLLTLLGIGTAVALHGHGAGEAEEVAMRGAEELESTGLISKGIRMGKSVLGKGYELTKTGLGKLFARGGGEEASTIEEAAKVAKQPKGRLALLRWLVTPMKWVEKIDEAVHTPLSKLGKFGESLEKVYKTARWTFLPSSPLTMGFFTYNAVKTALSKKASLKHLEQFRHEGMLHKLWDLIWNQGELTGAYTREAFLHEHTKLKNLKGKLGTGVAYASTGPEGSKEAEHESIIKRTWHMMERHPKAVAATVLGIGGALALHKFGLTAKVAEDLADFVKNTERTGIKTWKIFKWVSKTGSKFSEWLAKNLSKGYAALFYDAKTGEMGPFLKFSKKYIEKGGEWLYKLNKGFITKFSKIWFYDPETHQIGSLWTKSWAMIKGAWKLTKGAAKFVWGATKLVHNFMMNTTIGNFLTAAFGYRVVKGVMTKPGDYMEAYKKFQKEGVLHKMFTIMFMPKTTGKVIAGYGHGSFWKGLVGLALSPVWNINEDKPGWITDKIITASKWLRRHLTPSTFLRLGGTVVRFFLSPLIHIDPNFNWRSIRPGWFLKFMWSFNKNFIKIGYKIFKSIFGFVISPLWDLDNMRPGWLIRGALSLFGIHPWDNKTGKAQVNKIISKPPEVHISPKSKLNVNLSPESSKKLDELIRSEKQMLEQQKKLLERLERQHAALIQNNNTILNNMNNSSVQHPAPTNQQPLSLYDHRQNAIVNGIH